MNNTIQLTDLGSEYFKKVRLEDKKIIREHIRNDTNEYIVWYSIAYALAVCYVIILGIICICNIHTCGIRELPVTILNFIIMSLVSVQIMKWCSNRIKYVSKNIVKNVKNYKVLKCKCVDMKVNIDRITGNKRNYGRVSLNNGYTVGEWIKVGFNNEVVHMEKDMECLLIKVDNMKYVLLPEN